MPKTDGYKTKARILEVAEQLFAEKGFNGTSIDKIAIAAGVNKGLIYYHFKDKKDIINSVFRGMIEEIDRHVRVSIDDNENKSDDDSLKQKIRAEIEYCSRQRRTISVMLMESLKADGNPDSLFKCSEMVIRQELDGIKKKLKDLDTDSTDDERRILIHEFFTGFIPIILFVTLREKWCDYFNCDKDKALDYFLEAFSETHLKNHPGSG